MRALLVDAMLVALGSALGGLTRWGINIAAVYWLRTIFPFGTLFINVTGSLFLGWLYAFLDERTMDHALRLHLKLFLGIGVTGAYTTFSTFEYETHRLLQEGGASAGLTYVALSLVLGLMAVWLGVWLGGG